MEYGVHYACLSNLVDYFFNLIEKCHHLKFEIHPWKFHWLKETKVFYEVWVLPWHEPLSSKRNEDWILLGFIRFEVLMSIIGWRQKWTCWQNSSLSWAHASNEWTKFKYSTDEINKRRCLGSRQPFMRKRKFLCKIININSSSKNK